MSGVSSGPRHAKSFFNRKINRRVCVHAHKSSVTPTHLRASCDGVLGFSLRGVASSYISVTVVTRFNYAVRAAPPDGSSCQIDRPTLSSCAPMRAALCADAVLASHCQRSAARVRIYADRTAVLHCSSALERSIGFVHLSCGHTRASPPSRMCIAHPRWRHLCSPSPQVVDEALWIRRRTSSVVCRWHPGSTHQQRGY